MSDTLTHRTLRIDDAAAVAELLMAMERAEPVDEAFSEQDLNEEFSGPGCDLGRGSIGIFQGDRLIAAGWLLVNRAPAEWRATLYGGVHPDHTGRGLGRRILRELEDRASVIRDAETPDLPGVIKVGVDGARPRSLALLAAAGYETWRYFFRMRRDLAASVTAVPAPGGVQIRPYLPGDDEAVRLLSNETFADHWSSTPMDPAHWRAQFAESVSFRPGHSLVAVLDGGIVSFLLVAEFDADTAQRGHRTGYVARVGTARSVRGRRIASALLATAVQDLAAAGYRFAELDVDSESPTGAGRLYQRAGFETVGSLQVSGRRF